MQRSTAVWVLAVAMATVMAARGDFKPCERPFIFMDKADIEGARRRLKEPWAEEALKPSLYLDPSGKSPAHPYHGAFEVMVRGNEAAAEAEKQKPLTLELRRALKVARRALALPDKLVTDISTYTDDPRDIHRARRKMAEAIVELRGVVGN